MTIKRRDLLKGAAGVGLTAAAATHLAKPALAQGVRKLRMQTTWPKNFPGLGTGANFLAETVKRLTGGKIEIEVFGAGEIVGAFQTLDAVQAGTLDMGHGAPYYWKGKLPATEFIAVMLFGLNFMEQNAWIRFGGGQELGDKVYKELGCKFFPSGNTGVQMGGWFNKEMNSLQDYRGLKMRIPGLGGEVVKAAGGQVVLLPGGEIPPALASGAIDATEWVGPYNDMLLGLHRSAKFYYYPGWHEPATLLDNFISLKVWDSFSNEEKAMFEAANAATNERVFSEFQARNNADLQKLITEHKVQLKRFPDELLQGLGKLSGEVLQDLATKDALSREVFESQLKFRETMIAWSNVSERAYYNARALEYPYGKK